MALTRRSKPAQGDFFPGFTDVAEIGIGSLATVYRAREVGTNRLVALKLLNVRDASPRALESFERESVALGAVSSHPNIVTLFRSFRAADGRPVLVLELCAGSIGDRYQTGQGLPVTEVVALGIKIAAALETAHRAQILHRDVKPQNILLTEYGEPALADFGVAMLQSSTQTTAGLFDFTTLHAAPELLEGRDTSAATDVYELASTLYQLIAGRSAFRAYDGESPASVILRILRDPVQPLQGTTAPTELSDLLVHAMSKDKADRPPSAAEFAAQLAAVEAAQGWARTPFLIRDPSGASAQLPPAMLYRADGPPVGLPAPPPPPAYQPPPPPVQAPSVQAPSVQAPPPVRTPPSGGWVPVGSEWSATTMSGTPVPAPPPVDPEPLPLPLPLPLPEPMPVPDPMPAPEPPPMPAPEPPPAPQPPEPQPPAPMPEPPMPQPPPVPDPPSPRPVMPDLLDPVLPPSDSGALRPEDLVVPGADGSWPFQDAAPGGPQDGPPAPFVPWRSPDVPPEDAPEQAAASGEQPNVPPPLMHYPIPPSGDLGDQGVEQAGGSVPTWSFRAPSAVPAGPAVQNDLRLDPASLRERVTLRSGGASLTVDAQRLSSRSWLKRQELSWVEVLGFETRRDGDSPTAGGVVVAVTHAGPVELPATRGSAADLRYVHALLEAYRHRAATSARP